MRLAGATFDRMTGCGYGRSWNAARFRAKPSGFFLNFRQHEPELHTMHTSASAEQPHRLYVAEFPCGVVKAGVTKLPRNVRGSLLRREGEKCSRIYYGDFHKGGFGAERNLLAQLATMGRVVEGREWFVDLDFDAAKALADRITCDCLERFGAPVIPAPKPRSTAKRGFASMSAERRKEIASLGGIASHKSGNAHRYTSETARDAGRRGGFEAHRAGVAHQWTSDEARAASLKARGRSLFFEPANLWTNKGAL